ncbi:MAG: AAA family ATPase [Alphaproteobacteria bacterium]|nr:AAA family ATPase [Alphaproteobacteria bacterium]
MAIAAYLTYGADDSAAAQDIARELEAHGLPATLTAVDRAQAVLDARAIVALLSPAAEADEGVQRDLAFALANGKPVIPVVRGDTGAETFKRLLEQSNRVDARSGLSNPVLSKIVENVRVFAEAGRTIAMLNIKGGVGKTVLAANVFAAAHLELGKSVCFVDLDPQHNLSQYFLPPEERNRVRADAMTIYSVFIAKGPLSTPRESFQRMPVQLNRARGMGKQRFDLVVGDERLFEFTLDGRTERERADAMSRFHDLIAGLRAKYDLVVIDVNPCATFLTRCAVTASDHIVAPVRPEKYSLTGLNMLEQVTREIRQRSLKPSEFTVLLNGVADRPRTRNGFDVDQATRDEIAAAPFFGSALIDAAIPYTTHLRTTPIDKYVVNPISLTAMKQFAQRMLKESLASAAIDIIKRAGA